MKKFYSVIYNDDGAWDYGSTRKRDAIKMANEIEAKEIAIIDVDNQYCVGRLVKDGSLSWREIL